MSEAPTGLLAWGQGGIYDAIDDRLVISAVTRYRTGLTWPIEVAAGAGLNVIVRGGWLGVADCGDRTSAVVGSRTDTTVIAIPGPGTGSREDLIWVDVQPDEGRWLMRVITEAESAGRSGLLIGRITAGPGSTLASQMDIRSVNASLERRLMIQAAWTFPNELRNESTWIDAGRTGRQYMTAGVRLESGQWYKATFTANSPMAISGDLQGRIGIGMRTEGQGSDGSNLGRACVISYRQILAAATHAQVIWTFRHIGVPVTRNFDGRIWVAGTGTYYHCSVGNQGDGLQITVEDIGS